MLAYRRLSASVGHVLRHPQCQLCMEWDALYKWYKPLAFPSIGEQHQQARFLNTRSGFLYRMTAGNKLNPKLGKERNLLSTDLLMIGSRKLIGSEAVFPDEANNYSGREDKGEEEVDMRALVELEVELYRQEGFPVPDVITELQWKELLLKTSRKSRKKYLVFLWKIQKKKENRKKQKELQRELREEKKKEAKNEEGDDTGHIQYGLWRNSIFLYIRDSTMMNYYNSRLISAMVHGQPLVLDLGYDSNMTSRERQNCAFQLQLLFADNRIHPDPFDLHFCNAKEDSDTRNKVRRYIPTLDDPEFPLNISQESYLKQFPKEKLVYLTPHCREEMTTYDHDAVYIVGGIVDKAESEPLSLAKAKREGIKMQKLPLDKYLRWGNGGKCLTLNQIVNILLDIKHTGDWNYALRHVPQRKLRPAPSVEDLENMLRKKYITERKRTNSPYQSKNATHARRKKY